MTIFTFEYELLLSNAFLSSENKTYLKACYYYSLKCGILGFENKNLYSDIKKYCDILKPRVWNIIDG